MATLTLKQVPDDLYKKLKERAAAHQRSLNEEVIYCLEQTVQVQDLRPHSRDWLEEARALRRQTPELFLTEEALRAAKDSGRPWRQPGRLKGKIHMAEDFDVPLPDALAAAFRGETE